ncbi:hypothetical protein CBR_g21262 [Chara braunii]|uniref:Uncharacterized protein n=1 Tax=Chara braunii TaxID=69332 RepID=A0A388L1B6_CHABU|nr:hypothetical protein CBR_g21262 [Chara braunii]|eukprot:GBG76022.1 hypothetical protein CBR_g21262 [Chara braunii]
MAPRGQSQLKRLNGGSDEGGGGQSGRGHVLKSKRPCGDGSEGAMGGQGGEDVSAVEIPSTGMPTLGFGRDDVSRVHFQALAALGVLGIGHGGGSGSVRSQGIVISESAPQTPVTSMATIVFVVECADKGPVNAPQGCHVEPSNRNTVGGSAREVVTLSSAGSGAVHGPSTAAGKRGSGEVGRKDERRDGTPRPNDENDESLRMMKKKTRWIFRSSSRSDGFARAESYVVVNYPTDLARAAWQTVEWSRVVLPSVVYHTLALRMDIPLWYEGVYIEDRPEDNDMAAHQESTVLHLVSCFHDALRGSQWSDNEKMSQSRLSRFGDAFRLLLATCMWIMRIGGDDVGSHEEALYFSQLVAKPKLMAVGSPSFS